MSVVITTPPSTLLLALMIQKQETKHHTHYIKAFREWGAERYAIPLAFALARQYPASVATVPRVPLPFVGSFRSEEQQDVYQRALQFLATQQTCILSVHVGFGKTFLAIKLAAHIGLKTLIVVPTSKKVLMPQWRAEIAQFVPAARVQCLAAKSTIDPTCTFYLIGSLTIPKLWKQLTMPFVIVDELHLVLSPEAFKSLLYIQPRFLLGLSATPYRMDGSDQLVELFFGRAQITRELKRHFVVNVLFTPFTFTIETTATNKVNWNAVLNQQAECDARNDCVVDILQQHPEHKFLVLCKRVSQIKALAVKSEAREIAVQAISGSQAPQRDARSLIGSIGKLGTGFSDASFTALILAGDCQQYYIQYLGRVIRNLETLPTIFDLVDDCFLLLRHYREREQVYRNIGAEIKIKRLLNK